MASTEALESWITAVEKELAELKQTVARANHVPQSPWWEKMFGSFAQSEGFEEAVRLGREYRESVRPRNDENAG